MPGACGMSGPPVAGSIGVVAALRPHVRMGARHACGTVDDRGSPAHARSANATGRATRAIGVRRTSSSPSRMRSGLRRRARGRRRPPAATCRPTSVSTSAAPAGSGGGARRRCRRDGRSDPACWKDAGCDRAGVPWDGRPSGVADVQRAMDGAGLAGTPVTKGGPKPSGRSCLPAAHAGGPSMPRVVSVDDPHGGKACVPIRPDAPRSLRHERLRRPVRVFTSGSSPPILGESTDSPPVVGFAPAANPRTGSARVP